MLAIYCRTSKNKEEGKDYSIEAQQQGGLRLAQLLGMEFEFYVDEGISGTLAIEDRPRFADMMSDIKKNNIKAVYCIDQSRIERNTDIWRFFSGECINYKCDYYPNGNRLDLNDPDSMLFANLLSLVNAYYSNLTSRKVKVANYNKAKIGKTHGMKAYGFKNDSQNNYVIDEEQAKHVRRIFELSLKGIGTYTIANTLNGENIPTKFNMFKGTITRKDKYTKRETVFEKNNVKWRGNVIYDMLKNELYKGIRVWQDLRIELPEIAIVSEELWNSVNNNLSQNKKNIGKKAEYRYLLNGLISCGHCHNEVLGKKRLKGNDNAYKCKGKRPPHSNCGDSRGISLPKLETFIITHLFHSKELKKLLLEAPRNGTESLQLKDALGKKKAKLVKTEKSIERLSKLLKNPELEDDENFTKDYIILKEDRKRLVGDIDNLIIKIAEVEYDARNSRTQSLLELYTSEVGFDEVKRLVHSLIERIEIIHQKENKAGYYIIKIKYKYYQDESIFCTNWQALKWYWVNYYRTTAITDDDLESDKELLRYLIEKNGNNVSDEEIDNFSGFESVSKMHESVILNAKELILFE